MLPSGVLVLTVEHGGSAWGHIEVGDALLSVDGHRIANNGTVRYKGHPVVTSNLSGESQLIDAN